MIFKGQPILKKNGAGGAKSFDVEKAWSFKKHSILSARKNMLYIYFTNGQFDRKRKRYRQAKSESIELFNILWVTLTACSPQLIRFQVKISQLRAIHLSSVEALT